MGMSLSGDRPLVTARLPMGTSFTSLLSNIRLSFAITLFLLGRLSLFLPRRATTRKTSVSSFPESARQSLLRCPVHRVRSPDLPISAPLPPVWFPLASCPLFPAPSPFAKVHPSRAATRPRDRSPLRLRPLPRPSALPARAVTRSASRSLPLAA